MTERERLLEAVAEAARETVREIGGTGGLFEALRELRHFDAHQPQPAVETVEVGIYRYGDKPWLRAHLMETDGPPPSLPWALVSRWRGPVPPLPTIPTIAAEVTP